MKAEWTRDEVDRIEDAAYNAGLAVGERVERERIIKLLFEQSKTYINLTGGAVSESVMDQFEGCGCCSGVSQQDIINLIKGEN